VVTCRFSYYDDYLPFFLLLRKNVKSATKASKNAARLLMKAAISVGVNVVFQSTEPLVNVNNILMSLL
jgi:hypothetical protein